MSLVYLPPELHQVILGCLSNDIETLKSCSLTCQAWVRPTRLFLFHNARLVLHADGDRLKELLDISDAARTGIASYIRDVIFSANLYPRWLEDYVQPLLSRLEHIEHLSIYDMDWQTPESRERSSFFLTLSPTITSLTVDWAKFGTPDDCMRLITAYPRLSTLHLNGFDASSLQPLVAASEKATIRIVHLTLRQFRSRPAARYCYKWLLQPPFSMGLRSLQWEGSWVGLHAFHQLLTTSGGQLKALKLSSMIPANYTVPYLRDLNLSCNGQLVSLDIELEGRDDQGRKAKQRWVPTLFSTIQSPCIRSITLRFSEFSNALPVTEWSLAILDWDLVDNELESLARRSPVLSVFHLHLASRRLDGWMDNMTEAIPPRLAKARAAGVKLDLSVEGILYILRDSHRIGESHYEERRGL
ncbi:hypothetical protein WOLCODRAFT_163783 [Wolfiporia cocos MD-104 SS10]|uniref:F-box domain-containing protein n=1 Tax=Wolfiporia cocos (strain MD-104) TaxID=742152 RepID=A0A2H3K212_WOLCO|nr:hypothetical protein WOLCODRAFT_163783 [Wolfiporia cocos MD-104 SS10]